MSALTDDSRADGTEFDSAATTQDPSATMVARSVRLLKLHGSLTSMGGPVAGAGSVEESPFTLPTLVEAARERPRRALIPLQSWEGYVLEVGEDSFTARLVDLTAAEPDDEATIPLDELSDFDQDLVEPGAVFYWTIGYSQQLPRGQRERFSRIRFRRLPAWTSRQIEQVRDAAEALRVSLGWA